MGKESAQDNTAAQIDFNREQAARSEAMQREFAQNGIRWRTEDAKAAGLHPLFALGGSGATFTPSAATINFDNGGAHLGRGLSEAGQNLGRAVAAQQTPDQRALAAAQLKALEANAERDFAQASYWRSETARREQGASNPAQPFGNDTVTDAYSAPVNVSPVTVDGRGARIASHPLYQDAVKLKADEMTSRAAGVPGMTAGRDHPGMREFEFPGGFKAVLPTTDGGSVPEEIDVSMLPVIIGANIERFGARWFGDLLFYMGGTSPKEVNPGTKLLEILGGYPEKIRQFNKSLRDAAQRRRQEYERSRNE